jgi:ribosomal-protein-alanine N-acetyltransferase
MPDPNPEIRPGMPSDLPGITVVQDASPEAAHWAAPDYLSHDLLVACVEKTVTGFLVFRTVAPGEREILNLAVSPDFRRRGIGRALIRALTEGYEGLIFLEVRESNTSAREFYKSLNFQDVMRRVKYYSEPLEAAIVMKFHSC